VKIAINTRPHDGPWGGGNRFVLSLAEAAKERGHEVTFDLRDDTDLALIVDPRSRNPQLTFTPGALFRHLGSRPRTVAVHRINECDERKDTKTINFRLRLANAAADHTVFIASWLKDLSVWRKDTSSSVILNGGDERIFRRGSARTWDASEPFKLVTHHWGAHAKKGWDVYRLIDNMLGRPEWRGKLSMTFIGNAPADIEVKHITVVPPLDGVALGSALAEHHAYITASVNEPAGMHHVEGALTGLPLLYRMSGALPEYCSGFGEAFNGPEDIEAAIRRMMAHYPSWKGAVSAYSNTAARMTDGYLDLFEQLYEDRDRIAAARRGRRSILSSLLVQLPI
jgi:hypothetical protein